MRIKNSHEIDLPHSLLARSISCMSTLARQSALYLCICLTVSLPAGAGLLSSHGSGKITLASDSVPTGIDGTAVVPIPMAPGDLSYFYLGGGSIGAMMNMTFDDSPNVFLDHHGPALPPGGETFLSAGFIGIFENVYLTGTFSVSYDLDFAGLGPLALPAVSYPILWGSLGSVSFDETISFDSADSGHLGDLVLHVHPAPGSSGIVTFTGLSGLALPALGALDTLTLSGSFELTVPRTVGAISTIKVFGPDVPEPATTMLTLAALAIICWSARKLYKAGAH